MSTVIAEVVEINEVNTHPNADRLEIALVGGARVVVGKGTFKAGDRAVYFPPDLMVPEVTAKQLGVDKYLKSAIFPGDVMRTNCRVSAARIRSIASYGFLVPIGEVFFDTDALLPVGTDVTAFFNAQKYEPPTNTGGQGCRIPSAEEAPAHPAFHRYTDMERYIKYPNMIAEGEMVRVTEKLHGTNSRVGVIRVGEGEFEFMAGSHRIRRHPPAEGKECAYWGPLQIEGVLELLNFLCDTEHNVIIFGEIYGPGIQDMDYGIEAGARGYRVFDISVDGSYLDWDVLKALCDSHEVETVPVLYVGPFSREVVEKHTDGDTTLGTPACKFKGREGIVITPLQERYAHGSRVIVKSVSADYYDRKGAQDNGEVVTVAYINTHDINVRSTECSSSKQPHTSPEEPPL